MFGSKSAILVSISIDYEQARGEDEGGKHYMRPRHTWMISVQPHKHLLPGHKAAETVRYTSTVDPNSGEHVVQQTDGGSHGIAGNVLIREAAHATPDEVLQLLRSKAHETEATEDSEAWVRRALHALQQREVIDLFDVGEFMTFAHSYLGTRTDGTGSTAPAQVLYPGLAEKKAKGNGFRVSYPTRNVNVKRRGSEDGTYGGLM